MPSPAVIFDLDGTLADTLGDIADVANATMAACGGPQHDDEGWSRLVGHGARFLIRGALPDADDATIDEVTADFRRRYAQLTTSRTRPYPGVPELLTDLTDRQIPLAVFSNKPEPLAVGVVDDHFGETPFKAVRGARDDAPLKPDPTVALLIADQLQTTPDRIHFLGDTAVDIQTARDAGMIAVGAAWGFRDADELRDAGADHVIDHPEALLPLLDASASPARHSR
ncbi:MAG: HAD family hydrolase [Phycisphaeraceae bacterium]|nr:HAD family hydrolase [Phycisphaeraceae bacterium]